MTLEEFERAEPKLALRLKWFAGHGRDGIVMRVERVEGAWVAVVESVPSGEWIFIHEARCRPGCVDGAGFPRAWVHEGHVCCAQCEVDPSHRYQAVHE